VGKLLMTFEVMKTDLCFKKGLHYITFVNCLAFECT